MKSIFLVSFCILAGVAIVIQGKEQKKKVGGGDGSLAQGKGRAKYCIRSGSKCDAKWKCCSGNCVDGKCVKKGVKPTSNAALSPIADVCNGGDKKFIFWESQTGKCVIIGPNQQDNRYSELQILTCDETKSYHLWHAVVVNPNRFKLRNDAMPEGHNICIVAVDGNENNVGLAECGDFINLKWTDLNRRDEQERFQLENLYFPGKCLAINTSTTNYFYMTTCNQTDNNHWFKRRGC